MEDAISLGSIIRTLGRLPEGWIPLNRLTGGGYDPRISRRNPEAQTHDHAPIPSRPIEAAGKG